MSDQEFDLESIINIRTSLLEVWNEVAEKNNLSSAAKNSLVEYMELRSEMTRETDRGVALFATAQLEYQLKELLESKLVGSRTHKKTLFTGNGPLATFSSKISISYSIGFISKSLKEEIDIIRKIRNIFAHSKEIVDFDFQEIDSLCKSLTWAIPLNQKDNRQLFITSVSGVSGTLLGTIEMQDKFREFNRKDLSVRKDEYLKILTQLGLIKNNKKI